MSRPRKGKRRRVIERLERERQEKRTRRTRNRPAATPNQLPANPQALIEFLLDPRRLTTPSTIDENVNAFARTINPNASPLALTSEPEEWCRQGCCDQNVQRFIETHGGNMVCGYRLWYHAPLYIEAERHAVWQSPDGEFRDVSFSPDGERSIVFLPDVVDRQATLDQNVDKMRHAIDPRVTRAVHLMDMSDRMVSIDKMDNEEAWNTMPSYADWKKGIRKPSMWRADKPDA